MPLRLLRIPEGLTEAQHRDANERIVRERLDGLHITHLGGAYGPTWYSGCEHDLGFLRLYAGIRAVRLSLPRQSSIDALEPLSKSLEYLEISELDRADLAPLARFSRLTALSTVKNPRGIATVASLPALRDLTLWSYPLAKCGVVREMRWLTRLRLGYGTSANLDLLRDLPSLAYLSMENVGKLEDFSALSTLPALSRLRIRQQKKLAALPSLDAARELRVVILAEMTALRDVSTLAGRQLEEFALSGSGPMGELPATLKSFSAERWHVRLQPDAENARANAWMPPTGRVPFTSLRYYEEERAVDVSY